MSDWRRAYRVGAVVGALFFGWLTDRLGRRKLFFLTLFLYIAATAATASSWNLLSFALFRFLTGVGIGGEYTAIDSTIQELTPARVRGRVDLAVNTALEGHFVEQRFHLDLRRAAGTPFALDWNNRRLSWTQVEYQSGCLPLPPL